MSYLECSAHASLRCKTKTIHYDTTTITCKGANATHGWPPPICSRHCRKPEGRCDIVVICHGRSVDRRPLHYICIIIAPEQVHHLLSVGYVSAPDTLIETVHRACQVASMQILLGQRAPPNIFNKQIIHKGNYQRKKQKLY